MGRDRASHARGQLAILLVHKSCSQTNDPGIWPGKEATYTHASTLENGVLHNGQQPQSVVNGFVDHGEFEAMKMPIGRRAPGCDKDQFRAADWFS